VGGDKKRKSKVKTYAAHMIERVKELGTRDAFEPPPSIIGTQITAERARDATYARTRDTRRIVLVLVLAAAFIASLSLLLPFAGIDMIGGGGEIYSITEVLECYQLWFELNVAPLFDNTLYNFTSVKLNQFGATHDIVTYSGVINRAIATIIVIACGMMLALSGLLFQTAFRNPLATPSMLGVTDGVTLGCIVFILLGNRVISEDPTLYLWCVYGFGAGAVVVVLFLSRVFSGAKLYNIFDMLLLGTVISQLLAGINMFVPNFMMDIQTWNDYYMVQTAYHALDDPTLQKVVAVMFVLTMIPAFILRFRLNLIAFNNDDGRMMGVRAGALRALALALGSAMQLAAIASIGPIAMLSLVTPILVRYLMPSDFKSQFLGNCLVGISLLLIAMIIQHFLTISIVPVPVGTIVSVFIVPFFVWVIASGRGRWG
jgi:iron complex transport system permease protein